MPGIIPADFQREKQRGGEGCSTEEATDVGRLLRPTDRQADSRVV